MQIKVYFAENNDLVDFSPNRQSDMSTSLSSSSPPSRRESQHSTSDLLHVNSMELSPMARRLTVGWLTEIEIPAWLDSDKLPDWDQFVEKGRLLLALFLLVSAVAILWSTFLI